jgi:transcriptional regulator with XRE-family HTH domain
MATMTEAQRIGAFFRDIRIGRGVTLAQAAKGWSAPTLSRFERGELDISTDKAVELMARLGIENSDFWGFYDGRAANFPVQMLDEALAGQSDRIQARQQAYFAVHQVANPITEYAAVVFDAAMHWREADFHLSATQEQLLADRLAMPEHFYYLEQTVIKLIVGPASHELLELLKQRSEQLTDSWHTREIQLLMLWLGALMDRDRPLVDDLEARLESAFTQYRTDEIFVQYLPNWTYGKAAARWLRAPTVANYQAVMQIIADMQAMKATDDAAWFMNMFKRMQNGQVQHHHGLVDHRQSFEVSHNVAELFHHQRQYLGASLNDLAMNYSVSTLRRFETGQTQLGFGALVELFGELGMMPTQVFFQIGQSPDHPEGIIGLGTAVHQLQTDTQRDPAQIIDQFAVQVLNKPAVVLQTQRFILQTLADLESPKRLKNQARQILARLLATNHWGALEMFATLSVSKCLSLPELMPLYEQGARLISNDPMIAWPDRFFRGIDQALINAIKLDDAEAKLAVPQLSWLLTLATDVPAGWQAAGSWLIAMAILDPTAKRFAAVRQYLHRTLNVGHLDVFNALHTAWQDHIPSQWFDQD